MNENKETIWVKRVIDNEEKNVAIELTIIKENNGVREGTIIAALLVGFIARLFGRWFYFVPALLFPETDASLSTTDNI